MRTGTEIVNPGVLFSICKQVYTYYQVVKKYPHDFVIGCLKHLDKGKQWHLDDVNLWWSYLWSFCHFHMSVNIDTQSKLLCIRHFTYVLENYLSRIFDIHFAISFCCQSLKHILITCHFVSVKKKWMTFHCIFLKFRLLPQLSFQLKNCVIVGEIVKARFLKKHVQKHSPGGDL